MPPSSHDSVILPVLRQRTESDVLRKRGLPRCDSSPATTPSPHQHVFMAYHTGRFPQLSHPCGVTTRRVWRAVRVGFGLWLRWNWQTHQLEGLSDDRHEVQPIIYLSSYFALVCRDRSARICFGVVKLVVKKDIYARRVPLIRRTNSADDPLARRMDRSYSSYGRCEESRAAERAPRQIGFTIGRGCSDQSRARPMPRHARASGASQAKPSRSADAGVRSTCCRR